MPIKSQRVDADIILQSLSEIIQRPRLGTISAFSASGKVAANTANLVWYISGAGMHWGIYFWSSSIATQQNDYVRVIADGNTGNLPTFIQLIDNNFTLPIGAEATISLYNEVNFKYAGFGGAGKTWSNYHNGYYVETHGRTPTASVFFVYSVF